MQKIKVAVIGSAATRGCFELSSLSDLDNILEVSLLHYQSSLISIMSDPVKNVALKTGISPFTKKIMTEDFEKGIFDKLKTIMPDFVVMDFIPDITYGALRIGDAYVTNNKKKLDYAEIPENAESFTISSNQTEYAKKWAASFNRFVKQLKIVCPQTRIVVHSACFVSSYYEKNYQLKSLQRNDIQKKNKLLRTLEGLINDDDIYYIDLTHRKFHSSAMHEWKLSYLHYETKYYNEFLLEFFKLIIKTGLQDQTRDDKCRKLPFLS
ncbi:hypothetical protein JOD45_002256 [Scopulibacillus daqui]|uniref:Uncharacterized protein n=1 Tax=Scopulibacillus daqui TaxID=1469162 RepID=A0ABS2Q1D1_9BACL|nr:DUF6270 domain-containing protein [Scopulibacillus daqui]MBM7646031.1 hypothetical protein [Scopulibacillus daqui]